MTEKAGAAEQSPETQTNVPSAAEQKPVDSELPEFLTKPIPKDIKIGGVGKINIAKTIGFDPEALRQWALKMEIRGRVTEQALEKVGEALQTLGVKLDPLMKLAEEVEKAKRQTQQINPGQAQNQPPQTEGITVDPNIINAITKFLSGGGESNPYAQKLQKLGEMLIDQAIQNVTQKSSFEKYFEEEVAKAKAKAMAASVVTS